jgi:hypothetical protein
VVLCTCAVYVRVEYCLVCADVCCVNYCLVCGVWYIVRCVVLRAVWSTALGEAHWRTHGK